LSRASFFFANSRCSWAFNLSSSARWPSSKRKRTPRVLSKRKASEC